ncbi:hypothetical protein GTA08_BOTSDO05764 [Neofusicoccum parvum]|nr:hypothetical protein GTA08_BOTSDO05764 [Neofusicoccum parvum]
MDAKYEIIAPPPNTPPEKPKRRGFLKALSAFCAVLLVIGGAAKYYGHPKAQFGYCHTQNSAASTSLRSSSGRIPATLNYSLTISQAWRNPDGGRWRPLFVGNSESPFPTINAYEGDLVNIHIHNDLGLPVSAHWVGVHHKMGATWNDGSAGVTAYPILPRANWTSVFNTSGDWGLKWFLEHTSTPSVDGMYGTIWIRPSAERERPYHLISEDPLDQQAMMDAEENPAQMTAYNYQHREMPGLLAQLQKEGYDPYCFHSVLINGKGRVHCKPDDLKEIDGNPVNSLGCIEQPTGAVAYDECTPSDADYEVIETLNRRWMMINIVNPGLEHPWRISIDNHDFWIVANDGGFIEPQKVQVLTLTNAERVTIMVKLDQEPNDYAIRFHALSRLQFLQGYAILRYPHRQTGRRLGAPMPRPSQELSSMELDGSPKKGVVLQDKSQQHPYPPVRPAQEAGITLRFRATGAPDPYNPYITNCSLNGSPWQIFRGLREPLALHPNDTVAEPNPIVKGLPIGSVVDIIVENDLPVAIPMYKHNNPVFLLGSGDTAFEWDTVAAAKKARPDLINLENPPRGYLHDLPAGGWMAVRWTITEPAMTMFHAFRVRYFVLGMQVPMFEGDDAWPEIPDVVRDQPHVNFDVPEHMGIFD